MSFQGTHDDTRPTVFGNDVFDGNVVEGQTPQQITSRFLYVDFVQVRDHNGQYCFHPISRNELLVLFFPGEDGEDTKARLHRVPLVPVLFHPSKDVIHTMSSVRHGCYDINLSQAVSCFELTVGAVR